MHHDPNVSIEKSRAELRVLWEGEFAGKAPPSLGRDILALAIAYVRQERRYGGLARPVAIAVAAVLTQVHRRGLVHKDIKPANILVNRTTGQVKLTGFGIASRLPRQPATASPAGLRIALLAPILCGRYFRDETFVRFERFFGQVGIEFAQLPRVGDIPLVGRFGVFALHLDRPTGRLHAEQILHRFGTVLE